MKTKLLIVIIIFAVTTLNLKAQTWSPVGSGTDSNIFCLQTDTVNNLLYAGGEFSSAGGVSTNHIAVWNGINWDSLSSGINGWVNALCIYNNELYAGGNFTMAGGNHAKNIAKWNGSNWDSLGSGINGQIETMIVYNGELYVSGYYIISAGNINVNDIAKWNGTTWSAVGTGIGPSPGDVEALAIYNGDLYAGGAFNTAGGISVNNIAKWNGINWSPVGSGITNCIYDLTVYNGELYAGGNIFTAGGNQALGVAKWNGISWDSVGYVLDCRVAALAVYDNELYAGGLFYIAGGIPVSNIAKWNGANWSAVGAGITDSSCTTVPVVRALAIYNSDLYAGGIFHTAVGGPADYIAKWNSVSSNKLENLLMDKINVFPNPTKDSFTIETSLPAGENRLLKIYNMKGELYRKFVIEPGQPTIEINTTRWQHGTYLCALETNGERVAGEKIVVQ